MADIPVDERTLVARVEQVLHAPAAFAALAGALVTIEPTADTPPPEGGSRWTFFAHGVAFGESLALAEVGRLPVEDVRA